MERWLAALSIVCFALWFPLTADAADIAVITRGDRVNLDDHLVAGKLVLMDFYADWCGPCRSLEPRLRSLAEANADQLALRKIDIVRWSSPVTKQFGIRSIPHLKLFSADGRLLAEGNAGSVLAELARHLDGEPPGPNVATGSGVRRPGLGVPIVVALLVIAVVVALVGGARRRAAPPSLPASAVSRPRREHPEQWFVEVQGSIGGPFGREELARLLRGGQLGAGARVRRRGDLEWSVVATALSGAPSQPPREDV